MRRIFSPVALAIALLGFGPVYASACPSAHYTRTGITVNANLSDCGSGYGWRRDRYGHRYWGPVGGGHAVRRTHTRARAAAVPVYRGGFTAHGRSAHMAVRGHRTTVHVHGKRVICCKDNTPVGWARMEE